MSKNKTFIILSIVITLFLVVLFVFLNLEVFYYSNTKNIYDSEHEQIQINYDDDYERYEIWIEKENRRIYVNQNKVKFIVAGGKNIYIVYETNREKYNHIEFYLDVELYEIKG